MKNWFILTNLFLICLNLLQSQTLTQTIKGRIVDMDTQIPIIGANILLDKSKSQGAASDLNGNFKIENVLIGRHNIRVSYIGYEPILINQILVTPQKQVFLTIGMRESIEKLKALTVVASKQDRHQTINDMTTVSARQFTTEETSRYAGSFADPARAVSTFAGVSFSSDESNEIIIRGNSSKGLLWRLEGIEIPNPNHFSFGSGGTSGGISILKNTMLSNSDFFTGAFPAEYGNALSGVFDLNLRKGNTVREYALQFGVTGAQLTLEGPFSKNSQATYLANYNYSTLDLLNRAGLVIGGNETIIPRYQDLSFNIYIPTSNAGQFSIFGLGGISGGNTEPKQDSTQWTGFLDKDKNEIRGQVGLIGLNYQFIFNNKTYIKAVTTFNIQDNQNLNDSLDYNYQFQNYIKEVYQDMAGRMSILVNHKLNAQHLIRSGIIYSSLNSKFKVKDLEQNVRRNLNTHFIQAYSQWRFRVLENLEFNTGLHYSGFTLTNNHILEPRFGVKWTHRKHVFSYGLGLHSRLEPLFLYNRNRPINEEASFVFDRGNSFLFSPSDVVRLTQAVHNVLGYDWLFAPDFHLKTEVYYQELFNVPVQNQGTHYFSLLNLNSFDRNFIDIALVNTGRGYNYGVEITLEKFFSKQYYFLITGSLFESKYKATDGKIRNTRFNKNFVYNTVLGKEFYIGKTDENIISFNFRMAWIGGNRYTPIDLEESKRQKKTILQKDRAFEAQLPSYFRIDFKVNYRLNKPKIAFITTLDIQNVTDRTNIDALFYDPQKQQITKRKSVGIVPTINFKLEF